MYDDGESTSRVDGREDRQGNVGDGHAGHGHVPDRARDQQDHGRQQEVHVAKRKAAGQRVQRGGASSAMMSLGMRPAMRTMR